MDIVNVNFLYLVILFHSIAQQTLSKLYNEQNFKTFVFLNQILFLTKFPFFTALITVSIIKKSHLQF